jgi:glycosyltransferase involved in cell wall biosynthesis
VKILWVKTDFLHPTTRGGQIRTLEMLRELHKRHEVHYIAFDDPLYPEGLKRSSEYASYSYPVQHKVVPKSSPAFTLQLLEGLISSIPVAGARYRSAAMRDTIEKVVTANDFDAKVCDFLFPSINISDLRTWTLFQHNVESVIWERHAQSGKTAAHRAYFALQAKRMSQWERFGIEQVSSVPTGVDVEYFERPKSSSILYDLVFVGSMDWMPNIDGMRWFLAHVFPLIRQGKPDCRLAIVGRNPPQALLDAAKDSYITITGTVPDVRPFLWQSALSVVPLRVGGGTRLKIFEAMAAGTPVISTTIGAEGLPVRHGETIQIADTAQQFAADCLHLLAEPQNRLEMAQQATELVVRNYSWEQVTKGFERIILSSKPVHLKA